MDKKQKLMIIFVAALLLLLLPSTLRVLTGSPFFYGDETIYNSRILSQDQVGFDSIQERDLNFDLYIYGLNLTGASDFVFQLIPIILGMLSLVFFYLLVKQHNSTKYSLILLIISPVFIFIFSTVNSLSLIIFLTSLGLFLFSQKKGWISFICFALVPLINVLASVIVLIFLLGYSLHNKYKLRDFYVILVFSLITTAIMVTSNTISLESYFIDPSIQATFSEFGALPGLSMPIIILSLIGMFHNWKKANLRLLGIVILGLFLVLSVFSPLIKTLFAFVLPLFGAIGVTTLIKRKWSLGILKQITILLVFCSLLFPTVSFYSEVVKSSPQNDLIDSLTVLNLKVDSEGVVFSSPENGPYIQMFAERKTFIDSSSYQYPRYNTKIQDMNKLLYGRKLENTTKIIEKYNISIFYIDKSMKEKYWNNKEQGLLFLLRNSRYFIPVYNSEDIEIYQYFSE